MNPKQSYDNQEGAKHYLDFLESEDGQIFQKVLYDAFADRLGTKREQKILDAACGPGWLSQELSQTYPNIESCDGSQFFLDYARNKYPKIKFTEVDLNKPLPYEANTFDSIVFSMAAHDVEDQITTFQHFYKILKPDGRLLMTIVNPYYAYPVGVWKRGLIGRILRRMPELLIRPYHWLAKGNRQFRFNTSLECYFYKLEEHINNSISAGFSINHYKDLSWPDDSSKYNLAYRLYRYPIIIFLELKK